MFTEALLSHLTIGDFIYQGQGISFLNHRRFNGQIMNMPWLVLILADSMVLFPKHFCLSMMLFSLLEHFLDG